MKTPKKNEIVIAFTTADGLTVESRYSAKNRPPLHAAPERMHAALDRAHATLRAHLPARCPALDAAPLQSLTN